MIESFPEFLIKSHESGIYTLARFISRYIAAHWERIFEDNFAHLAASAGPMHHELYIQYLDWLFAPLNQALARAGYAANPTLPGHFSESRESGPEHERQRWLWSKITSPNGQPAGSILVIFYHDHTRLRIPRAPLVLPLEESGIDGRKSMMEASGELVIL